jgi:hypothetical protein
VLTIGQALKCNNADVTFFLGHAKSLFAYAYN